MAKKSLSRAAKKQGHKVPGSKKSAPEPGKPAPAPRNPVAKVAATVVDAVTKTAEVVQERVVKPVVAAVRPPKKKRARYARGKAEPRTEATPAPLPPRSKKAAGKLMTKNLALPPKDEPGRTP